MNLYLYEQTCDVCNNPECYKCKHGKNTAVNTSKREPEDEPVEEPAE